MFFKFSFPLKIGNDVAAIGANKIVSQKAYIPIELSVNNFNKTKEKVNNNNSITYLFLNINLELCKKIINHKIIRIKWN